MVQVMINNTASNMYLKEIMNVTCSELVVPYTLLIWC